MKKMKIFFIMFNHQNEEDIYRYLHNDNFIMYH